MRKLLLSLGSVAAAIAPVTAVIACGNENKTEEKTGSDDQATTEVETSEAQELKLDTALGKQDATNGIVLTFTENEAQNIAEGSYYFTKEQLKVGEEITVPSTEKGKTTTLKVKTAITKAENDVKADLETTDGNPVAVTSIVKAEAGVEAQFTGTRKNIVIPINDASGIATFIKYYLQEEKPELLYKTNEDKLKKAINDLLKSIDLELNDKDAFKFTGQTIDFKQALVPGAVPPLSEEESENLPDLGITFEKQDATNGIVLTFTENEAQNIAEGSYYFTKEQLKVGKKITVPSTEKGKTTTLKVKTAITKAENDVKADLETTDGNPVVVTSIVKAEAGVATKHFVNKGEFGKAINENKDFLDEVKTAVDKYLEKNYVSKAETNELKKSINQLLRNINLNLNHAEGAVTINGPTVTIKIKGTQSNTSSEGQGSEAENAED